MNSTDSSTASGSQTKPQQGITRRKAFAVGGLAVAGTIALDRYTDLFAGSLYHSIKPTSYWQSRDFSRFLASLSPKHQQAIMESLGKGKVPFSVDTVKKEILWNASNIYEWPFVRGNLDYDFHAQIVKWTAKSYGIPDVFVASAPTFVLERKILDHIFVSIWDKLSEEQRLRVLFETAQHSGISGPLGAAGLASAGGATALAGLTAARVALGFKLYRMLSSFICAAGKLLGLTFPMTVYTTASTTLAILTGPVGWTILGLGALASMAMIGRANAHKTAAVITAIHLIKAQTLQDHRRLDRVLADLRLSSA